MIEHDFDEAAIAVIGLAARMPGAQDAEAFWRILEQGEDTITRFSKAELLAAGLSEQQISDPAYVPAKGVLQDADCFDAGYFGLSPADAALIDPQQRVFVECAHTALEHAGYGGAGYGGAGYGGAREAVVGVFGGSILSMYLLSHLWPNTELMQQSGTFQTALGNDPTFLSTRVSYLLNLKGPSVSLGTACSTGLVAVHQACQSLLAMECDMALAGAVSIHLPLVSGYQYAQGSILSPEGDCRPFDSQAAGTVSSDGAGVVALKRLSDALADGDTVHAVIRGSAINNDGHDKVGFTAPAISAQARVIAEAQDIADTPPETIAMIEAHAAGTNLGDPIEVAALREVFAGHETHCAIGSVKSNIGHVDAAAGIAGLIKTVLALSHQAIPASLHVETPNPELQLSAAGFYIPKTLTPYDHTQGPMRAGVSSFGIGGTNCHMVLQASPAEPAETSTGRAELLQLSAKTPAALEAMAERLATHLDTTNSSLANVAHTLRLGRAQHRHRLSLVAASVAEAAAALRKAALANTGSGTEASTNGEIAFMFPGLGDHYPAMGWELYCQEAEFRAQIDTCAALLAEHQSGDIRDVLFVDKDWQQAKPEMLADIAQPAKLDLRAMLGRADKGDEKAAKKPAAVDFPRGGQPAIFILEYALAQLLQSWGIKPKAVVGYSIGEFVAACLAGIFSLPDALRIVSARADLIENQVARGSMLAVPMGEADLRPLLPSTLSLSASNGALLSVVAGTQEALLAFQEQLKAQGHHCQPLAATYAYHSQMMDPIVPQLAAVVGSVTLNAPQIPCISCVTGDWLTEAEATDPHYWAGHLSRTVRFRDAISTLLADGSPALAELGPGQTLCAHAKAVQTQLKLSASSIAPLMRWSYSNASEWRTLLGGIGQLWSNGADLPADRLLAGDHLRRVPLPGYPFARERHWVEPPAAGEQTPAGRKPFEDWALLPHWRPAPVATEEMPADQSWLVFDDESALSQKICATLLRANAKVTCVRRGTQTDGSTSDSITLNTSDSGSFDHLLETLAAQSGLPERILFLWSVDASTDVAAAQEQGFFALQALCAALIRHGSFDQISLHVVARGLSYVCDNQPNPAQAPLLGVLRVAAQERPGLITVAIDPGLADPIDLQTTADALLQELAIPVTAPLVSLCHGQRWVEDYAPIALPAASAPCRILREHGVYVITGGLGGVGLAMAGFLARQGPVKLALLGRTALPADAPQWIAQHDAEDRTSQRLAQVQALRATGAEVITLAADVADAEAMESAFCRIETALGPVTGVFHCAGAIGADTFAEIARSTRSEAEQQFHAKVYGTSVLAQVLERREAAFCVLTSSLASILGGLGFSAYAAANLYMDAFAQARAGQPGTRWLSINWDAWRIGAIKSAVDGFGGTVSDYYMEPDAAAAACLHLLDLPVVPRVIISTGDLKARLRQWVNGAQKPVSGMTRQKRSTLPQSFAAPTTDTQRQLAEIWQDLFAIEPIGIQDNFFELGGHSLLATQMNARIASRLGVELPLTSVLTCPSVAELAEVVDDARLAAVDEQDMAAMLTELDGLSDEKIAALLEQDENG